MSRAGTTGNYVIVGSPNMTPNPPTKLHSIEGEINKA